MSQTCLNITISTWRFNSFSRRSSEEFSREQPLVFWWESHNAHHVIDIFLIVQDSPSALPLGLWSKGALSRFCSTAITSCSNCNCPLCSSFWALVSGSMFVDFPFFEWCFEVFLRLTFPTPCVVPTVNSCNNIAPHSVLISSKASVYGEAGLKRL